MGYLLVAIGQTPCLRVNVTAALMAGGGDRIAAMCRVCADICRLCAAQCEAATQG